MKEGFLKTKAQLFISIIILFSIQLMAQVNSTKSSTTEQDSSKVREYILLNNGEQVFGEVEYKKTNSFAYANRDYFLVDSTRYETKDVKAFQDSIDYYARIFNEEEFVKREKQGNVDIYSTTYHAWGSGGSFNVISTPHGSFTTYTPGSYGGEYEVNYFSKPNGNVLEVDYDNLHEELKDNIESMALLDEYRTLTYVKYGAGLAGLGLIIASFNGVDEETPPNFGMMALGGIVANLGIWIPNMMQNEKLKESIKVYNGLR